MLTHCEQSEADGGRSGGDGNVAENLAAKVVEVRRGIPKPVCSCRALEAGEGMEGRHAASLGQCDKEVEGRLAIGSR